MEHLPISDQAVLNRWRLVLGKNASGHMGLDGSLKGMDEALDFLYSREQKADERQEKGGLEASHLTVAAWLNEVRRLFHLVLKRLIALFHKGRRVPAHGLVDLLELISHGKLPFRFV